MSHIDPLKELEEVLQAEVREHTHRAAEEAQLAEKAEEKLEEVLKVEKEREHHTIKVVVDGVPVEVEYKENELLGDLIPRALEKAGHIYKKEDHWQIKYEGKVLDLKDRICDLKLPKDAVLFLSLEAGTLG